MEALNNNKNIKELEVLQQQVNEDNKYLIENKQNLMNKIRQSSLLDYFRRFLD